MLRSMTGYGKGESNLYGRHFTVEIKSVNHRYSDITVKMPRVLGAYEEALRSKLSERIFRGKVDVYVNMDTLAEEDVAITVNENLAKSYCAALRQVSGLLGLPEDHMLSLVAKFPDIILVEKNIKNEKTLTEMWEGLAEAADIAINGFVLMRETEGAALCSDILKKRENLIDMSGEIAELAPAVAEEYQKRLTKKVSDALSGVISDEARIIQEVTIFSDKSCIDEEITRLKSHLEQLTDILAEEGSVGKKLDFLIQEINREVNTMGSKSNDVAITRLVVEIGRAHV